jgi:DNA-binding NarL/FixJ family response regulator
VDRSLRVVLAEDSVLLREGLTGLLGRFGHEVVAAVGDAEALQLAVAEHGPDIVVTDVRMPPGFQDEGLHAAVRLRERQPALPVLVLSQYVQRAYAADLLDSGDGSGVGYLLKDRVGQIEEFIDALREVADGGTVVDPEGSYASSCVAAETRWNASRPGNETCSHWWPRAGRTARSPANWSSPRRRWASTSATSWPSWTSRRPTRRTAGCWRS